MTGKRLSPRIATLIEQRKGILLDISFGGTPQPRSITLGPHGDIRHDPRTLPFPLPDACCHSIVITHVLEMLEPSEFFRWFDELHRILKPHGLVYISGPYGGDESQGWLSDPTHKTRVVESTFLWLDARFSLYREHPNVGRPIPKPWHPQQIARVPGVNGSISYNCVLQSQPVSARRA